MARSSRRRSRGTGGARASAGPPPDRVETYAGEDHYVRRLTGSGSGKTYRCPGCDHPIPPATPHVVVWPVEGSWRVADGAQERRHWHTGCWRSRRR